MTFFFCFLFPPRFWSKLRNINLKKYFQLPLLKYVFNNMSPVIFLHNPKFPKARVRRLSSISISILTGEKYPRATSTAHRSHQIQTLKEAMTTVWTHARTTLDRANTFYNLAKLYIPTATVSLTPG